MPTEHTVETVKNMALDGIGELPLTNQSPYQRWLDRNFMPTVRAALRRQPWNFAIEMWSLNRQPDDPPFQWRYSYGLPNNWLRVLPLTKDGHPRGAPVPYEVNSDNVFTDHGPGSLRVRLVMHRPEPGSWDDLFAVYIAALLANGMANRFTQKATFVKETQNAITIALEDAELVNALEGTFQPTEEHDIIRVRSGRIVSRW